jgi:drug efflux transport system ATP-binding protein
MSDSGTGSMSGFRADGAVMMLEKVSKSFVSGKRKVAALQSVDMLARSGMITGLIGPDGSGKTTLMRLLTGLLEPDTGKVMVLGRDATNEALPLQASVGYMPQRFGLYEDLTVSENLNLYADLQGVPEEARPERFEELLHMTGLGPFVSRLSGRLSGGMKQKLGLACTLVRSPELLLLDEPTVGVDPVSRRELWSIIFRLVREEGMSVLLSTAYLDEAEHCDEVIMLYEGQLMGQGPPEKFSTSMKGRTYMVQAAGMKNRILQEKLFRAAGVTDAVVQGGMVRLVMEKEEKPKAAKMLPAETNVFFQPVQPRFEDGFIALLRQRKPAGIRTAEERTTLKNEDTTSRNHVIEVSNLQRTFGEFYAVRDVTFSVKKGEVFGLLGANGAGKSTTFRMLCGLLPPSAGHLSVAGYDLRRAPAAARAHIGYMSQKFSLYGNLTVEENLLFFSSIYGLSGRNRQERIAWSIDQFEFSDMADTPSRDLSLGHKQRLAMACSLMHDPDILFLDEPTSGVDPLARREFWHRINSLAEKGVTVMVTTHFMEEAEYCDSLAIMAAGEILAIGTPAEIRAKARSADHPEPTMEDAFISLIEDTQREKKIT